MTLKGETLVTWGPETVYEAFCDPRFGELYARLMETWPLEIRLDYFPEPLVLAVYGTEERANEVWQWWFEQWDDPDCWRGPVTFVAESRLHTWSEE